MFIICVLGWRLSTPIETLTSLTPADLAPTMIMDFVNTIFWLHYNYTTYLDSESSSAYFDPLETPPLTRKPSNPSPRTQALEPKRP